MARDLPDVLVGSSQYPALGVLDVGLVRLLALVAYLLRREEREPDERTDHPNPA